MKCTRVCARPNQGRTRGSATHAKDGGSRRGRRPRSRDKTQLNCGFRQVARARELHQVHRARGARGSASTTAPTRFVRDQTTRSSGQYPCTRANFSPWRRASSASSTSRRANATAQALACGRDGRPRHRPGVLVFASPIFSNGLSPSFFAPPAWRAANTEQYADACRPWITAPSRAAVASARPPRAAPRASATSGRAAPIDTNSAPPPPARRRRRPTSTRLPLRRALADPHSARPRVRLVEGRTYGLSHVNVGATASRGVRSLTSGASRNDLADWRVAVEAALRRLHRSRGSSTHRGRCAQCAAALMRVYWPTHERRRVRPRSVEAGSPSSGHRQVVQRCSRDGGREERPGARHVRFTGPIDRSPTSRCTPKINYVRVARSSAATVGARFVEKVAQAADILWAYKSAPPRARSRRLLAGAPPRRGRRRGRGRASSTSVGGDPTAPAPVR